MFMIYSKPPVTDNSKPRVSVMPAKDTAHENMILNGDVNDTDCRRQNIL